MHPLLKSHILFYRNGVAILSGFHDIPQNFSIGFTNAINKAKCWVNLKVKVQKHEKHN